MVIEPQHPAEKVTREDQRTLSTDNSTEIASTWSEELENQYTLYELLPAVTDLPAIHALAFEERYVEKESGEFTTDESLLQIGVLSFTEPDSSDHLQKKIKNIADTLSFEMMNPLSVLQRTIHEKISPGDITAINGDRATITVRETGSDDDLITEDDEFFQQLGDWSTFHSILEALADSDEYPLTRTAEEHVYEYHVQITLTPIRDAIDAPDVHRPLIEAIDNYQDGIFANKPSMAVTHAFSTNFRNTSQAEIADIIGVDASTVSHHLSDAETWIRRAAHTTEKLTD